jgi:hypothetical protein
MTAAPGAIHVLATTFEGTRAALSAAVPLARGSGCRLIVIVPQVVPYAVALEHPVNSTQFMMRHYCDLVPEFDGDAQLRLCVCRRIDDVVRQLLPPSATVVVGGRARGWLPSEEMKLVGRLAELGHHALFVPMPRRNSYRSSVRSYENLAKAVHDAVAGADDDFTGRNGG